MLAKVREQAREEQRARVEQVKRQKVLEEEERQRHREKGIIEAVGKCIYIACEYNISIIICKCICICICYEHMLLVGIK